MCSCKKLGLKILIARMNESSINLILDSTSQSYYRSYLERQIVASLFVIIGIVGFCGNSLVIIAVVLSRKLRTYTNAFVVNLAAADLLTCTLLPWASVAILSENGWPLPKFICVLDAIGLMTCLGCSINTLACIAVNRLVLITKPRKTYDVIYTPRHIAAMIFTAWLIAFSVSAIPLVSDIGEVGYDYQTSTCIWDSENVNAALYANIVGLTFYPIQLSTIIYCYLKIFWHIRKHTKQVGSCDEPTSSADDSAANQPSSINMPLSELQKKRLLKRQIDVTKNLFYIVCAFLICVTPYIGGIVSQSEKAPVVYFAALLTLNSCINFFVYATKHPDFKQVFKFIFSCKISSLPDETSISFIR